MKKNFYIFYILLFSLIISNSRVAFSRPGALLRLSDYKVYNNNELISIVLASEITSLGDIISHSSGLSIHKTNPNGMSWGLSYTMLPYAGIDLSSQESNLDYEAGFHVQSTLYNTGTTRITAGMHDFLLNIDDNMVSITDVSLFLNFSNTLFVNDYTLSTLIGVGTGRIAYDPHTAHESPTNLGIYLATKLKTPLLDHWGGVDFMTEFARGGLNIGLTIPFTREYHLSIGVTHIENLSDFSSQSASEPTVLQGDSPAIALGLGINLPKKNTRQSTKIAQDYPVLFIDGKIDSSLFHAGEYIYFLQDSLSLLQQEINNISGNNIALTLENTIYQDSLNALILASNINMNTHNQAMRHLSKSLRLYYQGDFKQALNEVDRAIALQPNIAISYARKGSIYYKLNQIDRATLNWNIALKLDPEYTEVREMLNALQDNKLRPLSTN